MVYDVIYCEQTVFGSYFQPLNTLSNVFFIIAAILLYFYFKNHKVKDFKSKFLMSLLFLIGIGSFLWHFHKSKFTYLYDIIPIGLFFSVYVYFLILRFSKNKCISVLITSIYLMILLMISPGLRLFIDTGFLNGAERYIFTFICLVVIICYSYFKDKNRYFYKSLLAVFFLLIFALIFRQIDLMVCSYIKIGVHFMWHLLVATASYFAVKALY